MDSRVERIEIKKEDRTVCEVWTRVMGYYRPTSAFNKGKKSEYQERRCFSENKAANKQ
jgi:anaerobic ribonucleoside-triphosphate reductase